MKYSERIQVMRAEHENFVRHEMEAWAAHPLLWKEAPLNAESAEPALRRYYAKVNLEARRREYLAAAREYGAVNGPFYNIGLQLDDVHVENCRFFPNRRRMLHALPKHGVVGEVGTHIGDFARLIREICKPAKLHLIDNDFSQFDHAGFEPAVRQGEVELHEGDSAAMLTGFPDAYFDWIYVDADHSYEGVARDINAARTKVKHDGLLVFNDYTWWSQTECEPYGVPAAVHELCIIDGWEMVYFALSPRGYHDVALRRIANYRNLEFELPR